MLYQPAVTYTNQNGRTTNTYSANGSIYMILKGEHVPAQVPGRYLEQPHIQTLQDVRLLILSITGSHSSLQQGGQVVGIEVGG